MARIVIEEPCEHGSYEVHESGSATGNASSGFMLPNCPGGSRRVLDPGSYVLIEKVDGEWPNFTDEEDAAAYDAICMVDVMDALAGGEQ